MEFSELLNHRAVLAPQHDPNRYFGWIEKVETEKITVRLTTDGSITPGVPVAVAVSLPNATATFAAFVIGQEENEMSLKGPYSMAIRKSSVETKEESRVRHDREIEISRDGIPSIVLVRDISATGMGVETWEEMPMGTALQAAIKIEGSEVSLSCAVRSCRALGDTGKYRVGLLITGGDRVSKGRWSVLLREAAQVEIDEVGDLQAPPPPAEPEEDASEEAA